MNNYIIKYHDFYGARIRALQDYVKKIKVELSINDFNTNETVKLLTRLRRATKEIIPTDPNHPDYYLKGTLAKFRRYKKGLQRYRLLFCFSNNPAVIVYLSINDRNHLRNTDDKNDPYREFCSLLNKGIFSHNPQDPLMNKWLHKEL